MYCYFVVRINVYWICRIQCYLDFHTNFCVYSHVFNSCIGYAGLQVGRKTSQPYRFSELVNLWLFVFQLLKLKGSCYSHFIVQYWDSLLLVFLVCWAFFLGFFRQLLPLNASGEYECINQIIIICSKTHCIIRWRKTHCIIRKEKFIRKIYKKNL